jgi:serine protease Do
MTKTLKLLGLLLAFSSNAAFLHAQSDKVLTDTSKEQNIIIRKKNSTNEKVTVVIDGNNITVNGKPIDDFKSKDIDIIKQDLANNDFEVLADGDMAPMAPMPPGAPQMRSFNRDMTRSIKSNSAFLGVMTEKNDQGAKITEVTNGSSAEKAGLKEGDIITKIGDDKVTGPDDLYKAVGKHKPEEKVTVTYLRSGKQSTANVTLGKSEQVKVYSWNTPGGDEVYKGYGRPYNFSFSWDGDKPRLGISAQDTEDGNGVKILDIDDDDSPAAKAGLKEGDVITQVNGKAITSTEDLKQSMQDLKKGDTVKITYKRNNQTQTVDVKFPKELKTVDL